MPARKSKFNVVNYMYNFSMWWILYRNDNSNNLKRASLHRDSVLCVLIILVFLKLCMSIIKVYVRYKSGKV